MGRTLSYLATILCFSAISLNAHAASYPKPEEFVSRQSGFQVIRQNILGFLGGKTLEHKLYFAEDGKYILAEGSKVARGTIEDCSFGNGFSGIMFPALGNQCIGVSAILEKGGGVQSIYLSTFDNSGNVVTKTFSYICQCVADQVRNALKRENDDEQLQSRGLNPEEVSKLESIYKFFIQAKFCYDQNLMFEQNDIENITSLAKKQEASVNDSNVFKTVWEKSNEELRYALSLQKTNDDLAYEHCKKLYTLYSLSNNQGAAPEKPF